jgi:N-methylhydantoinase A/oxoprolinase/acetone carboxylase beta subunit
VAERLAADGSVLVAPDPAAVPEVPEGVDAVAVVLLHADLDPTHERAVAGELARRGHEVVASHEVSPEFREFERTVTTVVNAALRPVCAPYLTGLSASARSVVVMTSAGGLVDVAGAAALPAALLLSGPAAGARAAAEVAAANGFTDAVAFDMGGTSTDVCLVLGGEPDLAAQHEVAGFPIRLPSLAVHTVGAGGGSIARIDEGGALVVGPGSAGAVPGPVCYGRGGTRPTVTDANLVAGRIPAGVAFPGLGELDVDAASAALASAGLTAEGVLDVVNATMAGALRRVSVEQGVDPAGLALVAFGGAGPLHACDLAEDLGIDTVVVPAAAGVLSAVGLLTSPLRVEGVRTWPTPLDHDGLAAAAADLAAEVAARLDGGPGGAGERPPATAGAVEGPAGAVEEPAGAVEGPVGAVEEPAGDQSPRVEVAFDCRYAGQSHELRVASVDGFPAEHRRHNGYDRPGHPVEVTAVRAVATRPAPASIAEASAAWVGRWGGDVVTGPTVVARQDCTIWVGDGWVGSEGALGALVLRRVGPGGVAPA